MSSAHWFRQSLLQLASDEGENRRLAIKNIGQRSNELDREAKLRVAERLTALRGRILEEMDAQNRLVRDAEDEATLLVMQLLEAQDLPAALRAHRDEVDDVFLMVVARLQSVAARRDEARAERLRSLLQAALDMVEENLPPAERLMNRLLRTETGEEANDVLEAHRALLNDNFLTLFDEYLTELERRKQDPALLEHLRQVRGQVQAKITILRA